MAISRMQQPRQMYGLGSFVKKLTRKVTRPFTKVAKKIVPKEVAGIMRVAAPFLPPQLRAAAYLLGTARQTGRISPMDLALVAAPTLNQKFGKTDAGFFAETFPRANATLFGAPEVTTRGALSGTAPSALRSPVQPDSLLQSYNLPGFGPERIVSPESTGLFGTGGKMFQFGSDRGGILDNVEAFRDKTKLGDLLLGGKEAGTFSKSKIAGLGIGTLSLIKNSKTPDEAGTALAAATGDSADYDRGYQLFSQLTPELFNVPDEFRMNVKDGGLMRTNYAQGSEYIRERPNFFKDLFLEREGGGGKDYMIPERAADFRKYYRETEEFPGLKVLDAPEGVDIFTSAEQAKKMNLDIAKELEAERILPVLHDKAMEILDVVLDMPDSEEKNKILYDINHGILDKQRDSGMAGIANARYETIQKYGYLLQDKGRGLGRKAQQADGGLMRTDYAMGSDNKGVVNPFQPKPIGPVLPEEDKPFKPKPLKPIKMAEFDLKDYMEEFERVFPEMIEKRGTQEYMDMLEDYFRGLAAKEAEGIMMAKEGGRANLALGTKPTPEESGLGGLPIEADMRYTGGFMPYGAKEKADDVPARLSKNEFVFTADAVRAAGGGSVNEGAKKMYATMKQLEKKPEAKGMMA